MIRFSARANARAWAMFNSVVLTALTILCAFFAVTGIASLFFAVLAPPVVTYAIFGVGALVLGLISAALVVGQVWVYRILSFDAERSGVMNRLIFFVLLLGSCPLGLAASFVAYVNFG